MSKRKQNENVNSVECDADQTTENQNGKGSTFVVTVVNDSIQGMHEWTEEETNLVKEAVDADGGQYNWDVIASAVPSKDVNQVKAYVMGMQQQDNSANQSANIIKAPIEIWTDLAQKLTSEDDKSASVCLPQLMIAAAAESVNTLEAGQPNYAQIYLYISSLLKGETPPSLPPLESSVVLSLIQDIVNKIRTSDVSGQMHYLSNWYKQFQSEKEAVQKNDSKQETPPQTKVPPTASAVKRTSSGRIVRPRVDLSLRIKEEDKATDTEGSGEDGQNDSKEHGNEVKNEPKPKPRSTSLNPFRIPVNLLNFKQTRSSLVAKQSPK